MRTFQSVPPASPVAAQGLLDLMTSLLAEGWLLGLKVAAPVLAAMLLATVAVGLLERFVPQCNTFSVGLPVRSMATLAIMTASLAALGPLVEMAWNAAAGQIAAAIQPGL